MDSCTVELDKRWCRHFEIYLTRKRWIKNIQIQQEAKSTITPFSAGSKVVCVVEDESGSVVAEVMPDFYAT